MNYQLDITKNNIQPHLDIERELVDKKNGLFTFILRVNSGNIVDCSFIEYVNAETYRILQKVILQKVIVKI